MRYVSTRGRTPAMTFKDAVLTGLAPDGGLLVPETIPDLGDELEDLRGADFATVAARVMSPYIGDIDETTLAGLIERAYARFDHRDVTPLVPVADYHVLELFHGPTLAFKDVALSFLGVLFEHILAERGEHLNILGATSGDTGSAAIAGVRGRDNMRIFILYPQGRTSAVQELQMTSVLDDNVHCLALEGSFDDCQALMKQVFSDVDFKTRCKLGAVNSVNWARVLAQIVYYVYAALALDARGKVSFAVPTGNFGDIFAGYLALEMGAPIERLILATNENDILARFFDTGVYHRGAVHHTISPSMDIQVASNFERYLFLHFGRDSERLGTFMREFTRTGSAAVECDSAIDDRILARAVGHDETLATIRDTYAETGYVLDPHTAVGVAAGRRARDAGAFAHALCCLATAHPAKFPESLDRIVGASAVRHPRLDALVGAPTRSTVLPASLDDVRAYVAAHAR